MASKHDFHKVIIGRSESVSFLGTNASMVPAKTDTGAYRSAVHASNIVERNGKLYFDLLEGHPTCGAMSHHLEAENFQKVWVANSFGHREERYEVRLKVKLGPKIFHARFTLANRAKKIYPILLGRKLLNGRFLVDSNVSSLDRVTIKKQYGIEFPVDEEEGRPS